MFGGGFVVFVRGSSVLGFRGFFVVRVVVEFGVWGIEFIFLEVIFSVGIFCF